MKCWRRPPGAVVVLLIGAAEPDRSLAQGPSGPGIVAASTNPSIDLRPGPPRWVTHHLAGRSRMEQIHDRVAGLDVHRDVVAACARVPGRRGRPTVDKQRFSTTAVGLGQLS